MTSSSVYNGDGLRLSHTVGTNTTDYVWDVSRSLPVVLEDGANAYFYGVDLIASINSSGALTYFTYDGLGSTAEVTDADGDELDEYSYDVFGALRSGAPATGNQWLFTGEQHDADSGLYYLRARHYDPETGRFLTTDPIMAEHPYVYARANPTTLVDRTGLASEGGFADVPSGTSWICIGSSCGEFPEPYYWLCSGNSCAKFNGDPPTGLDCGRDLKYEGTVCGQRSDGEWFGLRCCRDPFEVWTGKDINHYLECWNAELEWFTGVLADVALEIVTGPLPWWYQVPSYADTGVEYEEAQDICNQ